MPTNEEIVRATVTSSTLGTPGAGLSGPEQFGEYMPLARERITFLDRLARAGSIKEVASKAGNVARFTFGTGQLRAGTENVAAMLSASPTHSTVAYTLVETHYHTLVSKSAVKFSINKDGYYAQLTEDAMEAWWLDLLRLIVIGDTASADPSLNINEGWRDQIFAGGNVVNGALINGGDFTFDHLSAARQALPNRHKSNMSNYEWLMSGDKWEEMLDVAKDRATAIGDMILSEGENGLGRLYGRPVNIFDGIGAEVFLVDPRNLIAVVDTSDWEMTAEEGGIYRSMNAIALDGRIWLDPIIGDVTGCVMIDNLN